MAEFLKSLSKIILISITIIGFLALFFNALNSIFISLVALTILILIAFTFLMIYYINSLENKITKIEQKFIREKDLNKIRTDIEAIKLTITKK